MSDGRGTNDNSSNANNDEAIAFRSKIRKLNVPGDDENNAPTSTAVAAAGTGSSMSVADLAPLYGVFGQSLNVMGHKVIDDLRQENEKLQNQLNELKTVKITGPNGLPVYASGLLDLHGYPYVTPTAMHSDEDDCSWHENMYYVRMTHFLVSPVPILEAIGLEIYVGHARIADFDPTTSCFLFSGNGVVLDNNRDRIENCEIWFDVACTKSQHSQPSLHQLPDSFGTDAAYDLTWYNLKKFRNGESMVFGEVSISVHVIHQFVRSRYNTSTDKFTKRMKDDYRIYRMAEDAAEFVIFPHSEKDLNPREYRNITPSMMAEFGRVLFLVRDAITEMNILESLSFDHSIYEDEDKFSPWDGLCQKEKKTTRTFLQSLATIAADTTFKEDFMDRARKIRAAFYDEKKIQKDDSI